MIMLSFLFVVLFLTIAQIVIVTRQLDGGGGGAHGEQKRNSMRVQLRRPKNQTSIANRRVESIGEKKHATFFTSPTEEFDVFPMTEHESGADDEFSEVEEYAQTTFEDFLEQERTGVILAQPLERKNPNDDEFDDNYYDNDTRVNAQQVETQISEDGEVTIFDDDEFNHEEEEVGVADSQHNESSANEPQRVERCAINLFGLPRAFASLVLPSMITNVLKQNHDYHCDYFIHYYNITNEAAGRSGAGGDIHPQEILLLEQAVAEMNRDNTTTSRVTIFISDNEDDFQNKYGAFLNMIHTAKDPEGRLLYFPWKSKSYTPTSVNNIVKMWHSIDSVWQLMEDYAGQHFIDYTRVAMLRSDVVYVTPVDIWVGKNNSFDKENRQVVIPGFGRHPISDRIVFGPYDAVKEWAANRFSSLDDHVEMMLKQHPGQGMHSERFVKYNIIPRIQKLESRGLGRGPFEVVESETICFFRARADESVWIEDCDGTENIALSSITQHLNLSSLEDRKALVESTLGRACGEIQNFTRTDSTVAYLDCSSTNTSFSSLVVDDEEEEDQLGNILTRAETEAAIEKEIFLGLNTNTNETFGMAAEQTTEQIQEKDIVTLEEGAAGEPASQMENTKETANKQQETTSSDEQELGPEGTTGAGPAGTDTSLNYSKSNNWSDDDNTPHMTENDIEGSEDWGEPDEDILIATM